MTPQSPFPNVVKTFLLPVEAALAAAHKNAHLLLQHQQRLRDLKLVQARLLWLDQEKVEEFTERVNDILTGANLVGCTVFTECLKLKSEILSLEAEVQRLEQSLQSRRISTTTTSRQLMTVVLLDLLGYSRLLLHLEPAFPGEAGALLDDQVEKFIQSGLTAIDIEPQQALIRSTGDGAVLVFDTPEEAGQFAEALHHATEEHNRKGAEPHQKRWFRVGMATGELTLRVSETGKRKISGPVACTVARLEPKSPPGGLLIDTNTLDGLNQGSVTVPWSEETVRGKGKETFRARRRQVAPPPDIADLTWLERREEGVLLPGSGEQFAQLYKDLKPFWRVILPLLLEAPPGEGLLDDRDLMQSGQALFDHAKANSEMPELAAALRDLLTGQ